MKTARKIAEIEGWTGDAALYALSEPVQYKDKVTNRVIVSATVAPFSGAETYIFPAPHGENSCANPVDWGELDGSYRGGLSHERALANIGYTIIGDDR